jgi:sulfite reductase (ferredoxin)
MLEDLTQVPSFEADPSFYSDWSDPRVYSIGDMGVGECAGEVISATQFEMVAAERLAFEGQMSLDEGDLVRADLHAYDAMLQAALSLVKVEFMDVPTDPDRVVNEFRTRFYDTNLLGDRFAGSKFAQYLFKRHESPPKEHTPDQAHRIVEEAQLFIEAVHAGHDIIAERRNKLP